MKRNIRFVAALMTCGLVAALAGCSGGGADPAALEANPWQLAETSVTDGDLILQPAARITLAFDGTTASGFSGVNSFSGGYEASTDGSIKMGPFASTLMAGPEVLMTAEGAFMQALEAVTKYEVADGRLTLTTEDGATLTFAVAEPAELSGTSWNVTGYNNGKQAVVGPIVDSELTVEFGTDGTVSGNAGVNRFNGSYEYTGDTITIGELATTMMAGSDELMEQETAFLAALRAGTTWQIVNGMLDTRDAEGAMQVNGVTP